MFVECLNSHVTSFTFPTFWVQGGPDGNGGEDDVDSGETPYMFKRFSNTVASELRARFPLSPARLTGRLGGAGWLWGWGLGGSVDGWRLGK